MATNPGKDRIPHVLDRASVSRPLIIGMVHVPALPGSPGFCGSMDSLNSHCKKDAETLAAGGVDAIMIENFGDIPFFKDSVPAHTSAHMTAVVLAVKQASGLPVGVNILRNDGISALAIAHATSASFIRINVLSGARLCDQGIIEGKASEILRLRAALGAQGIKILADIDVKHSAPLAPRPLQEEAEELLYRAGAEGLIVSGAGTGKETPIEKVRELRRLFPNAAILIGSGATASNLKSYAGLASAFIVGSSIKANGVLSSPVDLARTKEFVSASKRTIGPD